MFLREVRLDRKHFIEEYPFTVGCIKEMDKLSLHKPITIFVGENGTGKSTLLEALAVAAGVPAVGKEDLATDPSLDGARKLADSMRLTWNVKTRKGFFLRAEDFLNFARRIDGLRRDLKQRLLELEQEYQGRSQKALDLARMPLLGELAALEETYDGSLEGLSHGESFLKLFQARLVSSGIYLLDEPETPLSPVKQLALIAMILDSVRDGCQFIIATHSPILMALPGAEIFSFDESSPRIVDYHDLEHVRLTRDFLNDPQSFLRHL